MLTCTADGKQPCSPRVSALMALSPKTPVAARDSAIQDHLLGLDQIAVAQDTAQNRMADHIDGPEAAAEGKNRILGKRHAPRGPQGKRRKHDGSNVNSANALGLAPAIAPAP